MGEDGDREHRARHEPGPALPASNTPGHHDHRDAGDGGERGRRLGHAEREERLDLVEATSQGRRRGDDDVDESVEKEQSAGPAPHRSLPSLFLKTFHGDGERVAGRPGTDGRRRVRRRWLHVGVGNDLFEESLSGATRLAGVQTNLHRTGRLNLHDTETVDRGEDRRETESASTFDNHRPRGSGRGAHAPIEESERRSRRAAHHGTGTAALGVSSGELQRVDVVHQSERQRFAEFGRRRSTGVAIETSTNNEPGATDHDRLNDRQDQQVEHEIAPEAAGVGSAHVHVVSSEVIDDRVE